MTDIDDYDNGTSDDEDEQFGFECGAYWDGSDWFCPLIGSEDCDWECPEGGIHKLRETMEKEDGDTK